MNLENCEICGDAEEVNEHGVCYDCHVDREAEERYDESEWPESSILFEDL